MNSDRLARDYLRRARVRREALNTLLASAAYADAVREAQEIVELILKGTLRFVGIDPPKRHDVRPVLKQFLERLPADWRQTMDEIEEASGALSRARSQAFYGDEEKLIPASELFDENDAERALTVVDRLLWMYERLLGEGQSGGAGS